MPFNGAQSAERFAGVQKTKSILLNQRQKGAPYLCRRVCVASGAGGAIKATFSLS